MSNMQNDRVMEDILCEIENLSVDDFLTECEKVGMKDTVPSINQAIFELAQHRFQHRYELLADSIYEDNKYEGVLNE
tara:strand:- start:36 stop:266 length:231 start_codon:yes stop_codon:yes gene_type:complete